MHDLHRTSPRTASVLRLPGPLPVTLAALALVAGCGGSSSSDSTTPPAEGPTAPSAAVAFPPSGVVTDAASVVVRGTAESTTTIASVRVDGVEATSDDGFKSWKAAVPVDEGVVRLVVRTEDVDGRVDTDAANVFVARLARLLANPVAVAFDANTEAFLLYDSVAETILSIDSQTGFATDFATAVEDGRALAVQPITGQLFLTTGTLPGGNGGILRFSLAGGDSGVVTGPGFQGPPLDDPLGIAVDGALNLAYVADGASGEVFEVGLQTGLRTVLDVTGDAPQRPAGVAFDPNRGRRIVVSDRAGAALFAIALGASPMGRVLSSATVGQGPAFAEPLGVVYDDVADRYLVADAGLGAILSVEPVSGDRELVSGPETGGGPALSLPIAPTLDRNRRLFVADARTAALLEVNRQSGARTAVYDTSFGGGPLLALPRGIALGGTGALAFVAGRDAVYAVAVGLPSDGSKGDAAAGERRLVSAGKAGKGDEFLDLTDLVRLPEAGPALAPREGAGAGASMFVTDRGRRAVLSVADDGTRAIVSDESTSGLAFAGPLALDLLPNTSGPGPLRAVVGDASVEPPRGRLVEVDLETGSRRELSGPDQGLGPQLVRPAAVVAAAQGDRVWALDVAQDAVFVVDLPSGNRTLLSVGAGGPSLAGEDLGALVLDATLERLLAAVPESPEVVAIDLVSGVRSVVSGPRAGGGPLLLEPVALALGGETLLALDRGSSSLMAVDPTLGERVLVSK